MTDRSFEALLDESSRGVPKRGMRTGEVPLRAKALQSFSSLPPAVQAEPAPERSRTPTRPDLARDGGADVPAVLAPNAVDDVWRNLPRVTFDPRHLERHRIIAATREDPAHSTFDVLRTRLLRTLKENGWTRVAITSPTKDCGKSFLAANLALSLSRAERVRTVLMDLDLRNPSLDKTLGVEQPGVLRRFLSGKVTVREQFRRFAENDLGAGQNLAFALNERIEAHPAELLLAPSTDEALAAMQEQLRPDVVLYDLPPALYYDDVIAFQRHVDGVLLVIGGGVTRAEDVNEVSRRLGKDNPLLGVVLNKAEGASIRHYYY